MSWFVLLGIAAVLAALAALTGAKPSGTKPVTNTRLMGAARVVLLGVAVLLVVMAISGSF